MRGALQAAARTDWRPVHPQMGQGTPLENFVTDAVIRRLDADSRGQDQVRSGRPREGHAPMDVDNPRSGGDSHAGSEG
eukprot:4240384-Pyramimonas_sp.AAC.1